MRKRAVTYVTHKLARTITREFIDKQVLMTEIGFEFKAVFAAIANRCS